jgi:hypothetical protein
LTPSRTSRGVEGLKTTLALAKYLVSALGLCTFRRPSRARLTRTDAVPTDQSDEAGVRTPHDEERGLARLDVYQERHDALARRGLAFVR